MAEFALYGWAIAWTVWGVAVICAAPSPGKASR